MSNTQAKMLFIKSRIYRGIAFVFLIIGFGVFLALYIQKSDGDIMKALHDPASIIMVLFPFLPAVVFSFMSSSLEKKAYSLLDSEDKGA